MALHFLSPLDLRGETPTLVTGKLRLQVQSNLGGGVSYICLNNQHVHKLTISIWYIHLFLERLRKWPYTEELAFQRRERLKNKRMKVILIFLCSLCSWISPSYVILMTYYIHSMTMLHTAWKGENKVGVRKSSGRVILRQGKKQQTFFHTSIWANIHETNKKSIPAFRTAHFLGYRQPHGTGTVGTGDFLQKFPRK